MIFALANNRYADNKISDFLIVSWRLGIGKLKKTSINSRSNKQNKINAACSFLEATNLTREAAPHNNACSFIVNCCWLS